MIVPSPEISMRRQAELLRVSRSGLYYVSAPTDQEELSVMRRLDELHLEFPFFGSRKLALELRKQGVLINRKRVQRLMRLMGIVAMVPQPNTSKPAPEHKKFPYLLRNLAIFRPNQVWSADITYIPMAKGFGYLVAIIDWFSRRVLSWRLSNSLDTGFCMEALDEALSKFERPDIFNTDQGAQFTSDDFTRILLDRGIKVSMDGKGRCIDNIFVERLWRSLKYEEIHLNAYDDLDQARKAIDKYMDFFNYRRQHQSLGYQTPDAVYTENMKHAA